MSSSHLTKSQMWFCLGWREWQCREGRTGELCLPHSTASSLLWLLQRVLLTLRIQKWFLAFSLCICCRTELLLYIGHWDRAAFWPRSCQCVTLTGVLQSNLLLCCCQSDSEWQVLLALCGTGWSLLQAFCWLKWASEQALNSFPWEEDEFFPLVTNEAMLPYQPSLQKGFLLLVKKKKTKTALPLFIQIHCIPTPL